MKSYSPFASLLVVILLLLTTISISESPPANTIPIVADRPNVYEVDIDTFLMLSWHYFDVLQAGDHNASTIYNILVEPAEETGMYLGINPVPTAKWGHWPSTWVARMSDYPFSSDSAYATPVWAGITIGTTTYTQDELIAKFSAPAILDSLQASAEEMDDYFGDVDQVWYYNTFDEASSRQWHHMTRDSIWFNNDSVAAEVDDYIPNVFTQARHLVGSDSLPTFEEVDPQGIFSWLKYTMEHGYSHPVVTAFALLHTLDWAGYDKAFGTFHDQANSIRSFLDMEYQRYSATPPIPVPLQNRPDMFLYDCYPFRLVGVDWLASDTSYVNEVTGYLDTLLLDHFEEGMDSTFITVRQVALDQEREIPSLYYPQAFGKCGGDRMWEITPPPASDTLLNYSSYGYRIPTPQEFLMNCNIALMRDVRALIPYCMITYGGTTKYISGYLDQNNLPFDAPYEEWVYTDRWRSDFAVAPPDSIPPFSDSCRVCDDFDPLWDLPDRPYGQVNQHTLENYMMWKFNAYGRLWNSMRDTFAQVATIAPEYTNLHWWEDYADCLEIQAGIVCEPQVRLFSDGDENGYAFYVNRNCYTPWIPVKILLYASSIPDSMAFDTEILDHSRRFLIDLESTLDYDYRFFRDTLEAGQGRLVQFFAGNLPADIRITEPDISASGGGVLNTKDYSFAAETAISVKATFYNMGTLGASDVIVHLNDLTDSIVLDSDTISFSGLGTTEYTCDDVDVTFSWQTDSDDIGVHILEIEAEPITSEPDIEDNSTTVVFQITPRDYAKTILGNPWNMTEVSGPGAPAWHTNDIVSMTGWNSFYSDSISGMFEGTISNPSNSNAMVLNTGSVSDNITTRLYDQFSMIAKSEIEMTITVHWLDVNLGRDSLVLSETIGPDWGEIGPIDLNAGLSGWSNRDVLRFWLEFNTVSSDPKGVRIGWVKLTE